MVIIDASQALDPGSIPGRRTLLYIVFRAFVGHLRFAKSSTDGYTVKKSKRRQPDLNRRGQSPPDFESGALTTRP